MPKMILRRKAEIIDEFPLDISKTSYTIGSDENNDFVVPDKQVSMRHIRIGHAGVHFYIEDLKSAFGTHLNGRPLLKRSQIVHGDEIAIGEHTLIFENDLKGLAHLTMSKKEKTPELAEREFYQPDPVFGGGDVVGPEETSDPAELKIPVGDSATLQDFSLEESSGGYNSTDESQRLFAEPESYYLVAIYGPYLGKKYVLQSGDTRIGRDKKLNDIVIRNDLNGNLDSSISRRHATLTYRDGRLCIYDKRSKTRTYVNQTKLDPDDEMPLELGDEIEIVSDQKSTIFRLAHKDQIDFSPPKKAGTWWVRKARTMVRSAAFFVAVIALAVLIFSVQKIRIISQKPDPLSLHQNLWFSPGGGASPLSSANDQAPPRSFAAADLSGDGVVDVVFTDQKGNLMAVDGKARETLWQNLQFRVDDSVPVLLEEINNDGRADVIAFGEDTRLRALDGHNGAEIWMSPLLGESVSGPPVVLDLNGDHLKDFLICTSDGQIKIGYASMHSFSLKTIDTDFTINSVPSAWDWDDDSRDDIFIGTDEGKVLIVDGRSNEVVAIFDFNEALNKLIPDTFEVNPIRAPVAPGHLVDHQEVGLVISSTKGHTLALEGKSLKTLWHTQYAGNDQVIHGLADLDGDGLDEVVLRSGHQIKALKGTGQLRELWQFESEDLGWPFLLAFADVNKDASNDVIVSKTNGDILILSGGSGQALATLHSRENAVVSPILIADFDRDHSLDMLMIRADQNLYELTSNGLIPKNQVLWGQTYGNSRHMAKLAFALPNAQPYQLLTVFAGISMIVAILFPVVLKKRRDRKLLQKTG